MQLCQWTHYVDKCGLKLTPSSGIKGVPHYTQLRVLIFKNEMKSKLTHENVKSKGENDDICIQLTLEHQSFGQQCSRCIPSCY